MKYTVVIGEEILTGNKAFLIAPQFTSIKVGGTVVASGVHFIARYVDEYITGDSETSNICRIALGEPLRITEIIDKRDVDWEVNE